MRGAENSRKRSDAGTAHLGYGFIEPELERLRSRYSLFEMKPSPSLSALEKPRVSVVFAAASRRPSPFESIERKLYWLPLDDS